MNASQTASRAPAATDQEAATSTGRLGRAPAMVTSGTTDPWRRAAASGMTMASAKRTEPSSGNGGTLRPPRRYADAVLGTRSPRNPRRIDGLPHRLGRLGELDLELREGILVAELRADVDQDQPQRGRERDREDDAEETEDRAARQQREDDERRVQPHGASDHRGNDQVVLGVTQDRVDRRDDPDVRQL